MYKAAHTIRKGFTLIEVLVVLAITAMLISVTAAGLTYLQNAVTLDNTIRDVKAYVQSAQSNARNSIVVRQGPSNANLSNNDISVGWVVSVVNVATPAAVKIVQRGVYFKPTGYDISSLRDDIKTLFINSSNQNIYCHDAGSETILYKGNAQVSLGGRIMYCAQSTNGQNDFISQIISGVQLVATPAGMTTCTPDLTGGSLNYNIFFTSGYGEAVATANNVKNCQIVVAKPGFMGNARAIQLSKETGSVYVCGNYCL
jgi:prepilin-type N-terminal cleavage/methylation domain-containing protein